MSRDERAVDLRSDTVTVPTGAMREAMRSAVVGDDVYGEDPTVRRLEALAAQRLGKEAALFVPSGTMGNQVALLTHAGRGEEVILEEDCHIYSFEVGGPAFLAGILTRTLRGTHGILDPQEIRKAVRSETLQTPRTALICLESPTNRGGGTIYPPTLLQEIAVLARDAGVATHLDGARIFNAAVALGIPAAELARWADSVMFCVSKSLAAPIGSLVVGRDEFIGRARRFRKLLGGGMRQVGVIAAAGIVALETMVDRLAEDHENARLLAEGLSSIEGIEIDLKRVQTNIVIFAVRHPTISGATLTEKLRKERVLVHQISADAIRCLTHKDVSRQGALTALAAIRTIMGEKRG
ncbi:MAG: GntG family PLP-dependent aldolase [Candidatus Methylomirabilales bacterium]